MAGQGVISLSEGSESVGGSEPSEVFRKGKMRADKESPPAETYDGSRDRAVAGIRVDLA